MVSFTQTPTRVEAHTYTHIHTASSVIQCCNKITPPREIRFIYCDWKICGAHLHVFVFFLWWSRPIITMSATANTQLLSTNSIILEKCRHVCFSFFFSIQASWKHGGSENTVLGMTVKLPLVWTSYLGRKEMVLALWLSSALLFSFK